MGAEENYLDKLLKSVTEPETAEETEAEEMVSLIDDETQEEFAEETEKSVTTVLDTADQSESMDQSEITDAIETMGAPEMTEMPDVSSKTEESEELSIDEIEAVMSGGVSVDEKDSEGSDELHIEDIDMAALEELSTQDSDLFSSDELHIEDIDTVTLDELRAEGSETLEELVPEEIASVVVEDAELEEKNLSVSDETVSEETEPEILEELSLEEPEQEIPDILEPEISEELNIEETASEVSDDLKLGELDLGETENNDVSETFDGSDVKAEDTLGEDGELEDVLSMLDDDADLAEINDILKKSDNKEPVQDEMMDLLNQMADDEAELVNAGVKDIVEDDGVPLPEMPAVKQMPTMPEGSEENEKKKKKKSEDKAPGAIGKFFNMLTEDLPGPTEEEYAAEDAAKAAKKQEEKEKKEQDKAAKDEEKKAKAEEKAAAKKAKADAAAQKKKEKDAAKAAKAEAKKAKQQAEAIKRAKRIPPKKIVAVAAFGASVFGAVAVSTTILSNQGYINVARRAFYDGDYKNAYLTTYGMELKDSDGLIQSRSEVIMKIQCWYDSYQNNLKLNRQREALDALIHGVASYDYINAEAEQYGVLSEVDGIKNTILNVLETEYGLDEAQVKELLSYEDALAYTMALNDIITGE